jgi:hypothetical protein
LAEEFSASSYAVACVNAQQKERTHEEAQQALEQRLESHGHHRW